MTVTFTAEWSSPVSGWQVSCCCDTVVPRPFQTRDAALEWLRTDLSALLPLEGCTDSWCASEPKVVEPVETDPAPLVNVSNSNAATILRALGVQVGDLCGSMPADDLMGRLLVASALSPADTGVPRRVSGGDGRATLVDFGCDAGYLQDRFEQLCAVARFAADRGVDVMWA